MYKIGLSSCENPLNDELFGKYKEAGIEYIEISPGDEDFDSINYMEIKQLSEKYGIKLNSFHMPFNWIMGYNISDKNLCKSTIAYFTELIKKGADIGIDKFVVHPSGEPIEDSERAEKMKCAKESLAELAEIAGKENAVIAVEDLPRSCLGRNSDEIMELISLNDKLAVCFDTNHLLSEDPADFIRKLGKRIVTTHVSDYDFINERHWLPGEGKVDWRNLLEALEEIGYSGVWLYEIGFKCPKTIIRPRDLTCDDFAKNARELFENKSITVIGKPKENLGMWE